MKSLFSDDDNGKLLQAYCKANHLAVSGNTVFPRKIFILYNIVSIAWFIMTAIYALWCMSNSSRGLGSGLLISLGGYAVVFLFFHIKFGVSKDKIEEDLQAMKRMNR